MTHYNRKAIKHGVPELHRVFTYVRVLLHAYEQIVPVVKAERESFMTRKSSFMRMKTIDCVLEFSENRLIINFSLKFFRG